MCPYCTHKCIPDPTYIKKHAQDGEGMTLPTLP